ncbi:MAG: single-stranded-DNA-specific exonuclease RecJ [Clostridia bacterium]|nr:single-stranded-DNA-specific exonuclease RecJ [Clostridia bacterium]
MNANYDNAVTETAKRIGLNEAIVEYLFKRGYRDYDSIHDFLSPDRNFVEASTLKNVDKIVERIDIALKNEESILIFGDYDCDGICATSILQLFFNKIGSKAEHFIPLRQDGYGLSIPTLEKVFKDYAPSLIITVDCGISAVAEVEYCRNNGIDIIVTDHHEPHAILPECLILNPKLTEDSPLRDICGAAVAMKLVEALSDREEANEYLDLVALATVADVVPLVGENRKLVYHGLKELNSLKREGVKQLAMSAELKSITSGDIGYRLAPRINALGRLNDQTDVVQLFLEKDAFFVKTLVEKIEKANRERQNVTKNLIDQCMKKITPEMLENNRILVLSDEEWETGVLGLVASRITTAFYRPCVLLGNGGAALKGSARSIPDVNIFKCIEKVGYMTLGFGGHAGAAGMSINKEKFQAFADKLNEVVKESYDDSYFFPKYEYDIKLSRSQIGLTFCKQLSLLEPFGEGNPAPTFAVEGEDCKMARIGSTPHVKCRLNSETDVLAFSKEFVLNYKEYGLPYEMTVDASLKEFNNREYVQLSVSQVLLKNAEAFKDNSKAFVEYAKTAVYVDKGEKIETVSEYPLYDNSSYGTLYLAFSAETAKNFLTYCKGKSFAPRISAINLDENPISTLLLYPVDLANAAYYSRVVLLDAPLSAGYVRTIYAKAPAAKVVTVKNIPFKDKFKALELNEEKVLYTAKKIAEFLRSGRRAKDIQDLYFDLTSFGYNLAYESFALHFYMLFDVGWLRVGNEFSLACYGVEPSLDISRLLTIYSALKEDDK